MKLFICSTLFFPLSLSLERWNRWVDKMRDICDTGAMNNTSAPPGAFLTNVFYMVMLVGKCQSELSSSVSRKPLCAPKVEPAELQQLSRPANTLIWREDRQPALLKSLSSRTRRGTERTSWLISSRREASVGVMHVHGLLSLHLRGNPLPRSLQLLNTMLGLSCCVTGDFSLCVVSHAHLQRWLKCLQ